MYFNEELKSYFFKNSCRYRKNYYVLIDEQEKFDEMVNEKLEKGLSLCDDVLLEQSELIDELVIDEMLLRELKEKK